VNDGLGFRVPRRRGGPGSGEAEDGEDWSLGK
jgi:hypothetical protein